MPPAQTARVLPRPHSVTVAALAWWLFGSGLHAWAAWRVSGRATASRDERMAIAAVLAIGTLSIVLHLTSIAIGLTFLRGSIALVAADLILWWLAERIGPLEDEGGAFERWRPIGVAQLTAGAVLIGILLTWVDVSSMSPAVTGTDAAHYHVPIAVNLALGASPFDLPATQHLYPMAGSMLDAWFILPLGDPLLIDLAMCLPFLLLVTALAWMFRVLTGHSGMAWVTWFVLALFSTRLFRTSSLVSADLWFAAAFVASAAVLLSITATRRCGMLYAVAGGLSLGLLVGSKTTGIAAAALLLVTWILLEALRRFISGEAIRLDAPPALLAAAAMSVGFAAGGVWLLRNWLQFGSPFAPQGMTVFGIQLFPGPSGSTMYLSVMGDVRSGTNYPLVGRLDHYVRSWMGRGFLPSVVPLVLIPIDVSLAWWRGRAHPRLLWSRVVLLAMTVLVTGVLAALLAGAPWTSLEWTHGLALRYVLPNLALLLFCAWVAMFPLTWRWYEDPSIAAPVLAFLVPLAIWTFVAAVHTGAAPPVSLKWTVVGFVVAAAVRAAARKPASVRTVGAFVILALSSTAAAAIVVNRDNAQRYSATAGEEREREAFVHGVLPESPARQVYLSTLASEQRESRTCSRRRFFSLVRFDEPLMLQSYDYVNEVFYAGRDEAAVASISPLGSCDYIVSSRSEMQTGKGRALLQSLARGRPRTLATAGSFVLIGVAGS